VSHSHLANALDVEVREDDDSDFNSQDQFHMQARTDFARYHSYAALNGAGRTDFAAQCFSAYAAAGIQQFALPSGS